MPNPYSRGRDRIRELGTDALRTFVDENLDGLDEGSALSVLENRNCTSAICLRIARNQSLTAYYSVRAALVANRRTPQGWAMRFVPYLYWRELVRFSADVRVSPPVRRAIDAHLRTAIRKLTLGEKISVARQCSRELIPEFFGESDAKVFDALLVNPRMTEEILVAFAAGTDVSGVQLTQIATHSKWSARYPIRRALVLNPRTPRSIAASILRHLRRDDLELLIRRDDTSVYLRRCIERLGLLDR